MAVTQISRIQHRRGLQQDLPQLSSAELGWSIDTRKLYIGNGTLEEGAPTVGITEILTEKSLANLTSFLGTYSFLGESAGFTAQTGTSFLNPTVRSFQTKLDDIVNIRDFGAVGDGLVDDTAAINRALTQIYKTGVNETQPLTRRTIHFPGGNYLVTDTLNIPPYATLVGAGIESTFITGNFTGKTIANIVDSKFQSGALIGTSSAVLPRNIDIRNIQFRNLNTGATTALFNVDSSNDVRFVETGFFSNTPNTANLVHILSTTSSTTGVTFDNCYFSGGGNGIAVIGNSVSTLQVYNSEFNNIANVGIDLGQISNAVMIGNYYENLQAASKTYGASSFTAFGENYLGAAAPTGGMFLGNLQHSQTAGVVLTTTPRIIANLQSLNYLLGSVTATDVIYEISNSSSKRFGTMTITSNTSVTKFIDNYSEIGSSFNANIYANATHLLGSVASGTGILNYNFKKFIY
jgi:polygalacturonase